jgi:phospholipid/cholesterol/gamma-HCH transport system substrate-binding protein
MKKILSKEFAIGVSVIVALVILIFGIDYLKGINLFKSANFYYVNYDNVAGLEVAAPVTIDGYKVGQVRDIEFNYEHGGKIKVVLALDKKLVVREGTTAAITQSMLSGASITLNVGKSDKVLPYDSEIAAATAPDLMATLSNEIVPSATSLMQHVDSLLYNVNDLVSNPALLQAINRLDGISYNLLGATGGLNTTLNAQTPVLLNRVNNVAGNLDAITADLNDFSTQLKGLPLDKTVENVNELTANLIAFSQQLNNQKSSLGLLMNDPELYNRLTQISADVDSLIVDIKRNPKRYISIKLL